MDNPIVQQPPPTEEPTTPADLDSKQPFEPGFRYEKQACIHCGDLIAENTLHRHEEMCANATPEQRASRKAARAYASQNEDRSTVQRKQRYWQRKQDEAEALIKLQQANGFRRPTLQAQPEAPAPQVEPPPAPEPPSKRTYQKRQHRKTATPRAERPAPQQQQPPDAPRAKLLLTIAIDFDMVRALLVQLGPELTQGISIEKVQLV